MYLDAKPAPDAEEWLKWYHNPKDVHVAPLIRARVEGGVVQSIQATRG
jgi:hypothetical protein